MSVISQLIAALLKVVALVFLLFDGQGRPDGHDIALLSLNFAALFHLPPQSAGSVKVLGNSDRHNITFTFAEEEKFPVSEYFDSIDGSNTLLHGTW